MEVDSIDNIESRRKFDEINDKLMINAIRDLSFELVFSKYHENEKEVLYKLKQLVDGLYYKKNGNKQ